MNTGTNGGGAGGEIYSVQFLTFFFQYKKDVIPELSEDKPQFIFFLEGSSEEKIKFSSESQNNFLI